MTGAPITPPDTFIQPPFTAASSQAPLITQFDPMKMTMAGRRLYFDLTPRRGTDHPIFSFNFGDVIRDISEQEYHPTTHDAIVISVTFVAGNPRHNPKADGSFLTVEQQQQDGDWKTVRNDHDYDTR